MRTCDPGKMSSGLPHAVKLRFFMKQAKNGATGVQVGVFFIILQFVNTNTHKNTGYHAYDKANPR